MWEITHTLRFCDAEGRYEVDIRHESHLTDYNRKIYQVLSPKLTVGFSQSSYILITYRVVAVVPVVTPPNGVGGDRTAKLAVTTTTVRHSDGTTTVVTSAGGAKL